MWRILPLFIIVVLVGGCELLQPREQSATKIIAKAGDQELFEENIVGLIPQNSSATDSAVFVEKFVDDWIKKQLLISRAQEVIDFNEAEIKQKVLEYQYALMIHDFEKRYIDQNIDTEVRDTEILAYYNEKSENFILRENLTKCLYFKIPSSAPNLQRFRRSLRNYPTDSAEVWDYSNQFSVRAFLDNSIWVRFNEVIQETPLKEINDKARFLQTTSSIENSDEDYTYFLKIFEYKLVGEIAPIEFVRESISDIIINKRKIELKKELEKNIYEEAKATNAFEIYNN